MDANFINHIGNNIFRRKKYKKENTKKIEKPNIQRFLIRNKRGDPNSSTSSSDFSKSLNESDIPLIWFKPRSVSNQQATLPVSNTYNLRSKQTTWYRPLPTAETSFNETPAATSTPTKKVTVTKTPAVATTSRGTNFEQVPWYRPQVSDISSSSNGSLENIPLGTTTSSNKPLLKPTTSIIKGNLTGVGLTAGESYQNIFEGHLGQAATDNPLIDLIHNAIYEDVAPIENGLDNLRESYKNNSQEYLNTLAESNDLADKQKALIMLLNAQRELESWTNKIPREYKYQIADMKLFANERRYQIYEKVNTNTSITDEMLEDYLPSNQTTGKIDKNVLYKFKT